MILVLDLRKDGTVSVSLFLAIISFRYPSFEKSKNNVCSYGDHRQVVKDDCSFANNS